jgi:prepilin-type N-terminal cleavage/methylation domain-containing protein/prepilin-type processing-associated H-X9-DG protein
MPRFAHRSGLLHRGFTLIELLVVVAIIAVLVAILLPALANARTVAKTLVCQANVKQIGLGIGMYLPDNNGKYPQHLNDQPWPDASSPLPPYSWWVAISEYVGDTGWYQLPRTTRNPYPGSATGTIGHCPTHDEQAGDWSYRGNSNMFTWPGPGSPPVVADSVPTPSMKMLVFEVHTVCWIPQTAGIHYAGWLKWPFGVSGVSVNTHQRVSNFLMCDLHVESTHYVEMMSNARWGLTE